MGTEAAKLIYRLRGQSAEWVNAQARNRGFWFMPVRGQPRCRIIASLFAMFHNLVVGQGLRTATDHPRNTNTQNLDGLSADFWGLLAMALKPCLALADSGTSGYSSSIE
jgi:hypothetical protein